MKIRAIEARRYDVPLKIVFRHASASRRETETVVVVARGESGLAGYGEGCPRSYVTGETVPGAAAFVRRHAPEIAAAVGGLDDLKHWIAAHAAEIDAAPAAFAALELALLDLLARERSVTVEALLGLAPLGPAFRYSAVLGDSRPAIFWLQFRRYWRAGFRDFKLKLSGERDRDARKIAHFRRRADPALRVRLDANNFWDAAGDCITHLRALDYPFFAIEEPLKAGALDGFREIGRALDTRIVLDESFLNRSQLAALADDPERWILNCRVSKLGGLIRALDLVEAARQMGIGVIVGTHVGETSLLTRAGLTLAQAAGDALTAQEGAFGTHLLKRDLCRPVVMFGDAGILDPTRALDPAAPGLGLAVDAAALMPVAP